MITRYYKLDQDYKKTESLVYKDAAEAPEGYVTYAELIELSNKPAKVEPVVEAEPKKAVKKATKKSTKK